MTPEQQRDEEVAAIERERHAFKKRQDTIFAVHRQLQPFGNGQISADSMADSDSANAEWEEARGNMDRIAKEIRLGIRR